MNRIHYLLLYLLSLWIAGCKGEEDVSKSEVVYQKVSCPFPIPQGVVEGRDVVCGFATVPEQHGEDNGKTIQLAIAEFISTKQDSIAEALIMHAGGPGESNFESFAAALMGEAGQLIRQQRNIVVVETRGYYYSKPSLVCPEFHELQRRLVEQPLHFKEIKKQQLEAFRQCYNRLTREGINLQAYNNVEIAADIAAISAQLGYDNFNFYGGSAGTIVAQHVMRDYPDRVKAVILNSGIPLVGPWVKDMASNAVINLQRIMTLCAKDPGCNEAFPDLEQGFIGFLDQIKSAPIIIPILDPSTGDNVELVLDHYRFAQWLMIRMYWNPQLPADLYQIINGDYSPIQQSAELFFPMTTFSNGLGYSVWCSEYDNFDQDVEKVDDAYADLAEAIAYGWFGPEFAAEVCDFWKVSPIDEKARQSFTSNIPTLILSGEFDHVIPFTYSQQLANNLSNSFHYVFPGVAHSPIDSGPCAIMMALEFLNNPTQPPDSTCLEQYQFEFIIP